LLDNSLLAAVVLGAGVIVTQQFGLASPYRVMLSFLSRGLRSLDITALSWETFLCGDRAALERALGISSSRRIARARLSFFIMRLCSLRVNNSWAYVRVTGTQLVGT